MQDARDIGAGPDARVGAEELEARLAAALDGAPGGEAGLFGPGSARWRVDREAALFLGAGRALLMQLAHPWVAAAIVRHSDTLDDPVGRFHRTFGTVYAMVFGTEERALAAARALHRRHAPVEGVLRQGVGRFPAGSAYAANNPAALAWVQATLVDTALRVHDLVLPPLPHEERQRYWRESRRMGALFGIPDALLPADWAGFQAEMARTLAGDPQAGDTLGVSAEARVLADRLLAGARPWLAPPGWYRDLTAQLLPRRLARAFGLDTGPEAAARAGRALARLRTLYPVLPDALRFVGPYQEARARLSGDASPRPVTALANLFWIGRARL